MDDLINLAEFTVLLSEVETRYDGESEDQFNARMRIFAVALAQNCGFVLKFALKMTSPPTQAELDVFAHTVEDGKKYVFSNQRAA